MLRSATLLLLMLALSSCGTTFSFEGSICGEQAKLKFNDVKDRTAASATANCPGGGGLSIMTTDSTYSTVLEKQAGIIDRLTNMLLSMAMPPVGMPSGYGTRKSGWI
jgi:hypothetical protein